MTLQTTRYIDLTHPIHSGAMAFPGDPECRFTLHTRLEDAGYRVHRLEMGSHQGTHLDAPSHFLADGDSVERLPLERLCGTASLIDLSHIAEPRGSLRPEALYPYAPLIQPGGRVLLYTGWDRCYGTDGYYTDAPYLTPKACLWLAEKKLALLGLDLPTLHPTAFAETHSPLLEAGTAIVESLRLTPLRPYAGQAFTLFVSPLPLSGVDGSPVRAFALVEAVAPEEIVHTGRRLAIAPVVTAADMLDAFYIRRLVFVEEQGVDMLEEHDELDRSALHVLARLDGLAVGTLRLLCEGATAKVGRFAVLKKYRGQGIGREMMQWVIRSAPAMGLKRLKLHAQTHAVGFYEGFGFQVTGPQFTEAGIPHVAMELVLEPNLGRG